jgi:hypothetical protein
LLYVRYADAEHPSGTVEQAAEGLLIGYIEGFSQTPAGLTRAPDFAAWTMICRTALELSAGSRSRQSPATKCSSQWMV